MSKESGLGDNLYIAGFDASGDIGQLGEIGGGPALLVVTGINKSAFERIGGKRDGRINYNAFFNPAEGATHDKLSALPTSDQLLTYCRGTSLGDPAACLIGKQTTYDPTRNDDGALTFAVAEPGNGYGLEWGEQLTAGIRSDSEATNGSSFDTGASASFGAQAYLHVFDFTGTDATVTIQDSADDSTFTDVTDLAFTEITAAPTAERIATGNTATIRRYLRAVTTTSSGFTALDFSVVVVKNETEGVVF